MREFCVPERQTITDEFIAEKTRELLASVPRDHKVKLKILYDYSNLFDLRNKESLERTLKGRVINPEKIFYLKHSAERRPKKFELFNNLRLDEKLLDANGDGDEVVNNLAGRFQAHEKKYKVLAYESQRREEMIKNNLEIHKKIKKAFFKKTLPKAKNFIESIKCPFN